MTFLDQHTPALPLAAPDGADSSAGEPWGRRLWLTLAAVVLVASCLESYGIGKWPMADDEVPSLVEMGLQQVDAQAFSVPANQIGKLPRAVPVWYTFQRLAIGLLPKSELSFRIPTLVCGILISALVFLLAARWRGLWFALALAIVVNGSQAFVYVTQLDRFYCMALLFQTLTLAAMWLPWSGTAMLVATGLLTVLAVLSHNVTVAVFVLAFLAACPAYVLRRIPLHVLLRSGVAALISILLYFLYLLPLVRGWSSTGNPTPVFVSFAAQVGIPVLALALFGCWLSMARRDQAGSMIWWTLMFAGSLCLFQLTQMTWNPRYFLFFMPAIWVLAAHSMQFVARKVGYRSVGAAWYCCVVLLLLPGLLSHYQDGSRHDYRQAAEVLLTYARQEQPILSDDAETISYYLPASFRQRLHVRTKAKELPRGEFFLVCRSNAWTPLPQIPHRQMDLVAEIYRRRYDQFSHILRVYRVAASETRSVSVVALPFHE
jgi:hypothetical protein